MRCPVNTKDSEAVESKVQALYLAMYPEGDRSFVANAFLWARICFSGKYRDYQPIDARYHDFEHTLQGTLCMVRLLRGRQIAGVKPRLNQGFFKLGLLAILLHDTGYLKTRDDVEGIGAKYTLTHVNRSAEFAEVLLTEKGFRPDEILAVQNMIRCTGVNVDLVAIPFQNDTERMVGFALGTADLIGQMAADDYIDKLPILFLEFAECARFNAGKKISMAAYSSALDLMQKTPPFWEKYVQPRINNEFEGLYQFLSDPYPDGRNMYLERIEANIRRLQQQFATAVC